MATLKDVLKSIQEIYQEGVNEGDAKGYAEAYKKAAELLFEQLKEAGFTPTDIEYGDGYFIFGMGTNATLQFHIKECPEWLFGVWWEGLTSDGKDVKGEWFAQYEETIDKFKPSASMFCGTIFMHDNSSLEFGLECDLKFIRDEPYLAFCRDYCYWDYNREYHTREEAEQEYTHYKSVKASTASCQAAYDTLCRQWLSELLSDNMEEGEELYLIDSGEWTSPRYQFEVYSPTATGTEHYHIAEFDGGSAVEDRIHNLVEGFREKEIYIDDWTFSMHVCVSNERPPVNENWCEKIR